MRRRAARPLPAARRPAAAGLRRRPPRGLERRCTRWPISASPRCSPCRGRCCWTWSLRRTTSCSRRVTAAGLAALLPARRDYRGLRASWRGDLVAGITVAVVALPLALGFGVASGLGRGGRPGDRDRGRRRRRRVRRLARAGERPDGRDDRRAGAGRRDDRPGRRGRGRAAGRRAARDRRRARAWAATPGSCRGRWSRASPSASRC